jgi:hypothetical protein
MFSRPAALPPASRRRKAAVALVAGGAEGDLVVAVRLGGVGGGHPAPACQARQQLEL